jgi:hypothetical protein
MARRPAPILLALLLAPTLAWAQPANPSFNLINKSDKPIREFFATPSGMENWGQNRLGGKTVPAGGAFPVRLRADGNCIYDMRVVFSDGRAEERKHVDACKVDDIAVGAPGASATATASAPVAHEASFRLINRGKSPITEVHATPVNTSQIGDNLLTDNATLAPQASRLFRMPPGGGCNYDLRVVFGNKQSRERKNADLCRITELPVQ